MLIKKMCRIIKQRRSKSFICACILITILYVTGITDYLLTKNLDNEFNYPLSIDVKHVVEEVLSGQKPNVSSINYYPYRFLSNSGICNTVDKIDLFIVVKSAMQNFGHRAAIRQTYGQRNVVHNKKVKLLFFLGVNEPKSTLQKEIDNEMGQHKDIIQMDFKDNYFNNTIKTMMSFRWLFQHCSMIDFYLFTDDDMYISVKNLFKYLNEVSKQEMSKVTDKGRDTKETLGKDKDLYAGYMFQSSPLRISWSKWRVSLEEYPWNKWPPYITAGAYVVSNKSMKKLYVASLFIRHFRFDDIYLSIVAKKVGIQPIHSSKFYFYKKSYTKEGYSDVIASHGYNNHEELIAVWNEQNM